MPRQPEVVVPHRERARFAGLGVLAILAALAGVSVAQGMKNALTRSQDFQWSGVRMLFAHIDPWANSLNGDPLHQIHLSQIPNYLPILYVLLAPLGLLPLRAAELAWALLNISFAVASAWIAARFYGLGRTMGVAVVLLTLMATATRQTIGNGQQALLVLFLWSISLLAMRLTDGRAAVAGISYFKFNFAPPAAVYLLLRGGVRALLFSAVPNILATLLVWVWLTHGSNVHELFALVTEPFAVSQTGYFPSGGDPNLMDVMQLAFLRSYAPNTFFPNRMIPAWVTVITLGTGLAICVAVLYAAIRGRGGRDVPWHAALLGVASFSLFKHHSYDSVVLLFPLCYALARWRRTAAKVAIAATAYDWYGQRALDQIFWIHFPTLWRFLFIFAFAVLMVLLAAIYRLGSTTGEQEPAREAARAAEPAGVARG